MKKFTLSMLLLNFHSILFQEEKEVNYPFALQLNSTGVQSGFLSMSLDLGSVLLGIGISTLQFKHQKSAVGKQRNGMGLQ